MRKCLIFALFLMIGGAINGNAQDLSSLAKLYKKKLPEGYNVIKYRCVEAFGDNKKEVINQINAQIEAFQEVLGIINKYHNGTILNLYEKLVYKRAFDKSTIIFDKKHTEDPLLFDTNWIMVEQDMNTYINIDQ